MLRALARENHALVELHLLVRKGDRERGQGKGKGGKGTGRSFVHF